MSEARPVNVERVKEVVPEHSSKAQMAVKDARARVTMGTKQSSLFAHSAKRRRVARKPSKPREESKSSESKGNLPPDVEEFIAEQFAEKKKVLKQVVERTEQLKEEVAKKFEARAQTYHSKAASSRELENALNNLETKRQENEQKIKEYYEAQVAAWETAKSRLEYFQTGTAEAIAAARAAMQNIKNKK